MKIRVSTFFRTLAIPVALFPYAYSASIAFTLELPEGVEQPAKAITVTLVMRSENNAYETIIAEKVSTLPFHNEYSDLPNGNYLMFASLRTGKSGSYASEGDFSKSSGFSLGEDEHKALSFSFQPFDPENFNGDDTFSGFLKRFDGNPMANEELDIVVRSGNYRYRAAAVTTDDSGRFEASNLSSDHRYELYQRTIRIGSIDLRRDSAGNFTYPPVAGDSAPNVTFKKLDGLIDVSLSEFAGKVIVLEFWATWCAPRQEPMEKLNTYRERYPEWGDQVELIALSIDSATKVLESHVKEKNWINLYHGWAGEKASRAEAPSIYGVTGVPSCFIIDQNGIIVKRGHPATMDVAQIVDHLLKSEAEPGISKTY